MAENERNVREERRNNFMEEFKNNIEQYQIIPNVARELIYQEFGVEIDDNLLCTIPLTFQIGWKELLKFVEAQPSDEFAIDVCGISLEYTTEYSETDKPRNIVPSIFHKRSPIFMRKENTNVPGYQHNDDLIEKYNAWRTVNLCEFITKVENDVMDILENKYGIDLMVSAAVFPIMAAAYAAGLQVARETKHKVNMYNVFEITVVEGDQVILSPSSVIKQYIKFDDGKRNAVG